MDASSILTNEARHDAFLRTGLDAFLFPTPYDTPLTAVLTYNLAYHFVVSYPDPSPYHSFQSSTSPLQRPQRVCSHLFCRALHSNLFGIRLPSSSLSTECAFVHCSDQSKPSHALSRGSKTGNGSGTVQVPGDVSGVAFAILTTFSGSLDQTTLVSYGTLAGPAEVVLA